MIVGVFAGNEGSRIEEMLSCHDPFSAMIYRPQRIVDRGKIQMDKINEFSFISFFSCDISFFSCPFKLSDKKTFPFEKFQNVAFSGKMGCSDKNKKSLFSGGKIGKFFCHGIIAGKEKSFVEKATDLCLQLLANS